MGAALIFACPDDGTELDLSQPDVENPDELIGRCPGCRRVFAVSAAVEIALIAIDFSQTRAPVRLRPGAQRKAR